MSAAFKCEGCHQLFEGESQLQRAKENLKLVNPLGLPVGEFRGEVILSPYPGYAPDICSSCFRKGVTELLKQWQQAWV